MIFVQTNQLVYKTICFRRYMSNLHELKTTTDILTSYLGLTGVPLNIGRSKLQKTDCDQIKDAIKLCESFGFEKKDLAKFPQLLSHHPTTIDNHYLALKETGFTTIDAQILARFRKVSNTPICDLKLYGLIPKDANVVENLISQLDPPPKNIKVSDLDEDMMWGQLHVQIIKRYLMWRLDATKDEIEQLFRVYKMIYQKSLRYICENIAIAEDLKFTPIRKLLKYGYLLHMYPNYSKTVLETMPNLAGVDLKIYMRRYPKLAMVSPKNYVTIYKMLKDASIPDTTIQQAMNIFHCSPETVKNRLNEISKVPEFKIHLHHPRVLKLIIHYNRAKYRLTFLQAVKLKCSSINIIGTDGNVFDKHVKEGVDVTNRSEVVCLVKHLLNSNSEDIIKNLKKHPYYRNVPLLQIEDTFNYLKSCNYTSEAILKAVQVLLYPKVKLHEAFVTVERMCRKRKMKHHQQLHLALYLMEKEYHFTGNGITDTIL